MVLDRNTTPKESSEILTGRFVSVVPVCTNLIKKFEPLNIQMLLRAFCICLNTALGA